MEKILAFGHKNPDTDTICSAIAVADLHQKLGYEIEAVRLGELNEETAFALQTFEVAAPRLVERVAVEAKQVVLVDHNEPAQSAIDIADVEVIAVIDHHRIAGFETAGPLYYRCEPVGCTATILHKMYQEYAIEIEEQIAGLLLSAIISDTLLLKSPTCTEADIAAFYALATIAQVDDVMDYGMELLKAGASLAGKKAHELITIDSKPFVMGGYRVEIAQINVVDLADIEPLKVEILAAMEAARMQKEQDVYFTIVTDILNNNSIGLISGDVALVERAFAVEAKEACVELPGVVSRKKQVVPVFEKSCM